MNTNLLKDFRHFLTSQLQHRQVDDGPIYRPLEVDSKQIRLIEVAPGHGKNSVICTFKYPKLKEGLVDFETISYVWGDPTPSETIFVDGKSLRVPYSSEEVLRRFRHAEHPRTLWLDAVCINQTDDEEKSHQVRLMTEIYGSGTRNLIWLGEDDGTGKATMNAIRDVVKDFERVATSMPDLSPHDVMYLSGPRGILAARPEIPFITSVPLLTSLFKKAWFKRLWTVQEASLSPSSICYLGDWPIGLEQVHKALLWVWEHYDELSFRMPDFAHGIMGPAATTSSFCGHPWDEAQEVRLGELVAALSDHGCFNPKDRVLGVLGLYQKLSSHAELPETLLFNYSMSLGEIYTASTNFILHRERYVAGWLGNLRFREEDASDEWPSWVPHWERGGEITLFGPYNAHNSRDVHLQDLDPQSPGVLSLYGLLVDVISGLLSPHSETGRAPSAEFLLQARDFSRTVGNHEKSKADTITALTLIAETTTLRGLRAEPMESLQGFEGLLQDLSSRDTNERGSSLEKSDRTAWQYEIDFRATEIYRVFATKSGRLGLGPSILDNGDVVAVLFGSPNPVALRPVQDRDGFYRILGVIYVNGIMDGEALLEAESLGREEVVIHLV